MIRRHWQNLFGGSARCVCNEYSKCAIVSLLVKVLIMAKKYTSLQTELRREHPALEGRQAKNARKRGIAVRLRALRDARGLTQDEVAAAAGMTQSIIARLEALSGPLPSLQSIERYVDACGGHLALLISDKEIDCGDDFRDAFAKARGRIPAYIDLSVHCPHSPQDS